MRGISKNRTVSHPKELGGSSFVMSLAIASQIQHGKLRN